MSPIYPKLREAGAVFGQVMGYERPAWFDPNYMSGMYLQWIVWHHVGTNLCHFDDISEERQFLCKGIVLPFIIVIIHFLMFFLFILLFSSSSPFLFSPCHHFLSRKSALTVSLYLCLCPAPCAVDVLTELLNVVIVKSTASGDVLPCDLVEN